MKPGLEIFETHNLGLIYVVCMETIVLSLSCWLHPFLSTTFVSPFYIPRQWTGNAMLTTSLFIVA